MVPMGSEGRIWMWASTWVAARAGDEPRSAVAAAARVEALRKARREVGLCDMGNEFPPGNEAEVTERSRRMQVSRYPPPPLYLYGKVFILFGLGLDLLVKVFILSGLSFKVLETNKLFVVVCSL